MVKRRKFIIGSLEEYIKANRKFSRNEEIAAYGRPLSFNRTWRSKKDYSRKQKHKQDFDE